MNILFVDTVHPLLEISLRKSGHICIDGSSFNREELLEKVISCEGLVIRSRIRIDRSFLEVARRLKFIARAGAGMENIDIEAAHEFGIVCLNAPEGNRDAVAEQAIAMILSLFNNLNSADREVREGKWLREANRGHELKGKVVGIIGYGNTGSSFAKKLSGFDCTILVYDKYKSGFSNYFVIESDLQNIFEKADILSLHVPLSDETEYFVNDAFIRNFRKNIWLVNTSRGKCLRMDDMVYHMKEGKVLGACLDVLEYEDISFEKFDIRHSNIQKLDTWQYLIHSRRVVLSPHIAGWTFESHQRISEVLFEKINKLKF
ncbi:MAG: hydroxyacid dehydrogenase [Bacteroidetes bacterium]|nr:MAG: hydroxyacid dehydrogenase [Bacteroidota bacterium]